MYVSSFVRHCVQTGAGTHPGSYPMGADDLFSVGKAAGPEVDHSPSIGAEVKLRGTIPPLQHMPGWGGTDLSTEYRENFALVGVVLFSAAMFGGGLGTYIT
jgi:hypothetical protein